MLKKWLFILSVIALIISCQKQDIQQHQTVYDYGYFPIDSGMWRQYDVTQIVIDKPSEVWDTARYQLREVYAGWFLNAANDSVMRIERSVRDSSHHAWQPIGVWQAITQNSDALQTEENIKYLKIKFPVRLNFDWDGNIYNRLDTLQTYRYTITMLNEPETVNNISFDSVLTVNQKEKISMIDKILFFEKYAYGVGLIDKQQIDIYSEDADPSIPIEQRITKGTLYYQKINSYGKK